MTTTNPTDEDDGPCELLSALLEANAGFSWYRGEDGWVYIANTRERSFACGPTKRDAARDALIRMGREKAGEA